MPRISDFPVKSAPSASAHVAGVDVNENGELINVQIPFSTFGAYKSYSYTVTHSGTNMFELITDLKFKGYTAGAARQPMVLTLHGALGDRIFVGYIYSFADDTVCNFELLDCARCTKYSQTAEGVSTTTPISTALNNATVTEFGGSTEDFLHFTVDSGSTSYLIDLKVAISKVVDDISKPTFVKLVGRNTRTVLMWFSMMGSDIGSVYCWDLVSRKYYYAEALTLPAVHIEDFFSTYEVKQESSGGGIIDVTEFPSNPSTTHIYRKWQIVKAQIVAYGQIITDGTMECEVVDTLPEMGNICYTGTAMYAYYQRADGEAYGYVEETLSAQMGVPVGWYPAATLMSALGYTWKGIIDSINNAESEGYYVLLTKKPHLYHYYDDSKGNIVKSAIITNDNYEFDEATGTLTQIIVL